MVTALAKYHLGDYYDPAIQAAKYEAHNEHIKAIVPPENLLLWGPQDGWDPLCKFLGVPVPEFEFPYVNESETFEKNMTDLVMREFSHVAKQAAIRVAVIGVALGAAKYAGLGPHTFTAVKSCVKGLFGL